GQVGGQAAHGQPRRPAGRLQDQHGRRPRRLLRPLRRAPRGRLRLRVDSPRARFGSLVTVSEDFQLGADFARALDAGDPLARFRGRFAALSGRIYLQANGLGLASREAEAAVEAALAAWKQRAHRGWEEGEQPWLTAERLGALQAPLVGAAADEVVATGTTTQNLHVLLATFYRPAGRRTKILADELNFPSDVFALQSQVRLRGLDPAEHLVLVKSRDGRMLEEDDVVAAMTDEITVLMLPSAIYR